MNYASRPSTSLHRKPTKKGWFCCKKHKQCSSKFKLTTIQTTKLCFSSSLTTWLFVSRSSVFSTSVLSVLKNVWSMSSRRQSTNFSTILTNPRRSWNCWSTNAKPICKFARCTVRFTNTEMLLTTQTKRWIWVTFLSTMLKTCALITPSSLFKTNHLRKFQLLAICSMVSSKRQPSKCCQCSKQSSNE